MVDFGVHFLIKLQNECTIILYSNTLNFTYLSLIADTHTMHKRILHSYIPGPDIIIILFVFKYNTCSGCLEKAKAWDLSVTVCIDLYWLLVL